MKAFKIGDRVKLLESHELFTDDTHRQTVTLEAGLLGVVVDDDDDACKYDEVPGPYRVKWDTGMESAYFHEDIQHATEQPAAAPAVDGDDEAEPFELSMQRLIPGLWRVTHVDGVAGTRGAFAARVGYKIDGYGVEKGSVMKAFEVGQRVRVKLHVASDHTGCVGKVAFIDGAAFPYDVEFEDGKQEGFDGTELELAPATAAPAVDGETWGVHPSQRELEAYGDGYAAGMLDGSEYAPLMNQIADLREQLGAAQAALKPFRREWDIYQDFAKEQGGRADVGNYLTNHRNLDIIMDACHRAAKALQATGGGGGQ